MNFESVHRGGAKTVVKSFQVFGDGVQPFRDTPLLSLSYLSCGRILKIWANSGCPNSFCNMPCEIIRPHDGSSPSFVLPDYEDAEESFYPLA